MGCFLRRKKNNIPYHNKGRVTVITHHKKLTNEFHHDYNELTFRKLEYNKGANSTRTTVMKLHNSHNTQQELNT